MQKKVILLASLILSLTFVTCLSSCNNDDDDDAAGGGTPPTSQGDVYVAGLQEGATVTTTTAVLWNNGKTTTFPSYEEAEGVAFSGDDVYVLGDKDSQSYYWKAGQPQASTLLEGGYGYEGAIAVSSNGDVYVGGIDFNSSPVYWKNGQKFNLPVAISGYTIGSVGGMTISGNDVYIAGSIETSAVAGAGIIGTVYWKNGELHLQDAGVGFTSGIAVSGNDVYVCGNTTNGGFIGKTGSKLYLDKILQQQV